MKNYSNWKIEKKLIKYSGSDESMQQAAEEARKEYHEVARWCNSVGTYHIESTVKYYATVKNPEPTPPTNEEIRQLRIEYRRSHIDDKTAERSRKIANNTWTDEDEQAYLQLDAEVTAWIEENLPYLEQGE